ncbi:MAG: site-specific DNA-methyltransferase [Caldilineae bacterium]|nr:MAG: site-specific DNA-methyltransferase [Caldilineae bacterium]
MKIVYPQPDSEPDALREPSFYQIPLPFQAPTSVSAATPYRDRLQLLLNQDLDFHNEDTLFASHDLHPFPAKFPPQLPLTFIEGLTQPGDVVLDPMMGSGTTVVEAVRTGRTAIGFDIDPLARLIARVKTTPLDYDSTWEVGRRLLAQAEAALTSERAQLEAALAQRWDARTRQFVDYWFAEETQLELMALWREIEQIMEPDVQNFLKLTFSSCIITKSGGVSLAFDLAHTRPHRAKVVLSSSGEVILGHDLADSDNPRVKLLTKRLKPVLPEFEKRLRQALVGLQELGTPSHPPHIEEGNAQALPLGTEAVDLIVTSPPYASNAIDYMRAHKFSLVWLGHPIDELGATRRTYIGGESTTDFDFEELPPYTMQIIAEVQALDARKGVVLHRYYSEMKRVLQEMYRVLRPDRAAIVVVASSIMRGRDTETDQCLKEIGEAVGFEVPAIGVRHLDRNKRMLPAGMRIDRDSQIQQRMHREFVIGFYKPSHAG